MSCRSVNRYVTAGLWVARGVDPLLPIRCVGSQRVHGGDGMRPMIGTLLLTDLLTLVLYMEASIVCLISTFEPSPYRQSLRKRNGCGANYGPQLMDLSERRVRRSLVLKIGVRCDRRKDSVCKDYDFQSPVADPSHCRYGTHVQDDQPALPKRTKFPLQSCFTTWALTAHRDQEFERGKKAHRSIEGNITGRW